MKKLTKTFTDCGTEITVTLDLQRYVETITIESDGEASVTVISDSQGWNDDFLDNDYDDELTEWLSESIPGYRELRAQRVVA
jgi:hypothetical protein